LFFGRRKLGRPDKPGDDEFYFWRVLQLSPGWPAFAGHDTGADDDEAMDVKSGGELHRLGFFPPKQLLEKAAHAMPLLLAVDIRLASHPRHLHHAALAKDVPG
jgi:hypothetical protein